MPQTLSNAVSDVKLASKWVAKGEGQQRTVGALQTRSTTTTTKVRALPLGPHFHRKSRTLPPRDYAASPTNPHRPTFGCEHLALPEGGAKTSGERPPKVTALQPEVGCTHSTPLPLQRTQRQIDSTDGYQSCGTPRTRGNEVKEMG